MKINKLTISNFAGIKVIYNFDGKDAKISAIMRLVELQQQQHCNGCFNKAGRINQII